MCRSWEQLAEKLAIDAFFYGVLKLDAYRDRHNDLVPEVWHGGDDSFANFAQRYRHLQSGCRMKIMETNLVASHLWTRCPQMRKPRKRQAELP